MSSCACFRCDHCRSGLTRLLFAIQNRIHENQPAIETPGVIVAERLIFRTYWPLEEAGLIDRKYFRRASTFSLN